MTKDNHVEYRTQSLRNASLPLFIAGILTAFSIYIMFLLPNIWVICFMAIPALLLPLFIKIVRARRLRIGMDYLETVTLFKTKRIYLNEVNKFGVFFARKYTWPKATSQSKIDNCEDNDLFGFQIYLSKNIEFDLNSFKPMRHINFPYKKHLYIKVKELIEKSGT